MEREFAINGANSEETSHTPRTLRHFVDVEPGEKTEDKPEHSITPGSEGNSGHHLLQRTDADTATQSATRHSLVVSLAVATAVRQARPKRKRSSQSNSEAGAEHAQSEKELMPAQFGDLNNHEDRAFIGAGGILDEWIIVHRMWLGEQ